MRWIKGKIAFTVFATTLLAACASERTTVPISFIETAPEAINVNTAGVEELRRIPNIGEKLAADIVKFRETHGPFRRPEHLLLINGVSDRRFREVRHLVRVE